VIALILEHFANDSQIISTFYEFCSENRFVAKSSQIEQLKELNEKLK